MHPAKDPLRPLLDLRIRGVLIKHEEYRKLVAAHAAGTVLLPQGGQQRLCDQDQEPVSVMMAEEVIILLETAFDVPSGSFNFTSLRKEACFKSPVRGSLR